MVSEQDQGHGVQDNLNIDQQDNPIDNPINNPNVEVPEDIRSENSDDMPELEDIPIPNTHPASQSPALASDPMAPPPPPPPPNNPIKHLTNAHNFISIKLTAKNYLLWANQLEFFLLGQGLMGFIDGTIPCPPPDSPDFSVWIQQDAAIVSTLISSLSESLMPRIIGKRTSQVLWNSLKRTYAKASSARTMELRTRLLELKQGEMCISDYFAKASLIKEELAAIGKDPKYDDFLCQVMHNLRPEFNDMKNSILARKDEADFEEVQDLLLSAESLMAQANTPSPSSALVSPDPQSGAAPTTSAFD